MRIFITGLLALLLAGCALLTAPPISSGQQTGSGQQAKSSTGRTVAVRLYTSASDLANRPFRDLGEVSGDACQTTPQDPLPEIPLARRRMQLNAGKMSANAVLQHRCEIISGTPGCYRQAVCRGSALFIE